MSAMSLSARRRLEYAWVEHGEVGCGACGAVVDLSDADALAEAGQIWRSHIEDCDEVCADD